MLYSMTGYSQAVGENDSVSILAEIKSLNSRFLESSVNLPMILSGTEEHFLKLMKKFITRGRVKLSIQILNTNDVQLWEIGIDEHLLNAYGDVLERVRSKMNVPGRRICIDRFLTFNELFIKTPDSIAKKIVLDAALSAAENALKALRDTRRLEGKVLQTDIQMRVKTVKAILKRVKKSEENYIAFRFKKLREKIEKLAENIEVDTIRLTQEVAYIAAKADITEEIIRLEIHISRLEKAIKSRKPVGSLLNFILQECHRETNTIGSKTDIKEISECVIDLKEEFERIKEQVQNIE